MQLEDASAFNDATLNSLLGLLLEELMCARPQASSMVVHSLAEVIAVQLARKHGETRQESHSKSPSLPGYKLRQIIQWMSENLGEEYLERLAAQARLSKFSLATPLQSGSRCLSVSVSVQPANERGAPASLSAPGDSCCT